MTDFPCCDIVLPAAGAQNSNFVSAVAPINPTGLGIIGAKQYLVAVQPNLTTVDSNTRPRGRYFAAVFLLRTQAIGPNASRATVWRGYVTFGCPVSIPNLPLGPTDSLIMEVWTGSNAVAGDRFQVMATIENAPSGGTQVFNEEPFTGIGETIEYTPANPAVGAEATAITVPANVRWYLRSYDITLVTSATVSNRVSTLLYQDPSANFTTRATSGNSQAASLTTGYYWTVSAGQSVTNGNTLAGCVTTPAPQYQLRPSWIITTRTVNLQGGDQYQTIVAVIEEWAGPNT